MKWWIFINYKIYEFYENTSETMPEVKSASVSAVLLQLNILLITGIIYLLYGINILFHVATIIILLILTLLFNYFTIYKDKKYIQLFKEMEQWEEMDKKPKIIFNLYFFTSVISFFILIIYRIIKLA